jgi:hypothetical protein
MDYKNGKIYKIVDIGYTKMYIGSTTQSLSKRFSKHKGDYISWKNNKHSKVMAYDIFEEFGIDNCKIELIEECPCENKIQLFKKEGEYIQNNECVNKVIPGRTMKEWQESNKDKIAEYNKEYFQTNKDKFAEHNKEYFQANKDKIKKYYQTNKDKIVEYNKEYFQANKDKLKEYRKTKAVFNTKTK